MSCLGVHFAITGEEAAALEAFDTDEERLEYVTEELEEKYFADPATYKAESDKAWDVMHRALADGEFTWDGGEYPLSHTVLGGESQYEEPDYLMSLKTPEQVRDIAAALDLLTEADFRARYDRIDTDDYDGELGDEDFGYTWEWLQSVRALYRLAAVENRYVLFTADQ